MLERLDLAAKLGLLHLMRVVEVLELADLILLVAHNVAETLRLLALSRVHLLDVQVRGAAVLQSAFKAVNLGLEGSHGESLRALLAATLVVFLLAKCELGLAFVETGLQVGNHPVVLGAVKG